MYGTASRILTSACLGLALLMAGCRASMPNDQVPGDTNAELIEHIAEMPYVTADAAYRAIYILVNDDVFQGDYAELKTVLRQRGLPIADLAPHECPTRQEIAKILVEVCGVMPGLNYRLTGFGRYALRDLQYARIVRTRNDYGPLSGGEFLGMLGRAEDYMLEQKGLGKPVDLGSESPN